MDQLPRHLPHHGYSAVGLVELRAAIARRYANRGLATPADQILVTNKPTGLCLSERGRAELDVDCPVIVDETMSELALDVEPPVPLAAHHRRVITLGSTAKTFWGGLRVGWVRADADLVQQLRQARPSTDWPIFVDAGPGC